MKTVVIRTGNPTRDQLALSQAFLRQARVDNAGGGYCAKGVANLLQHVGLDCTRGDAYTWKNSLPQNGWIKLEGIRPEDAPPGAVLVFDRSANSAGKGGGTEFGHVEIVTVDTNGRRQYVSDAARDNWGGTVPQNFVGVYVHPSLHRTQDGIHYSPNLDTRTGGAMAAGGQGGSSRNRDGGSTAGLDPALVAFLNNPAGANGDAAGLGGSSSSAFNNNANVSAFLVLAMMISAIYGIEMDTGARRPGADPGVDADPAGLTAGTDRTTSAPAGVGG